MVEDVKEFSSKLQLMPFLDMETLEYGKVEIDLIRTAQVAMACIPVLTREQLPWRQLWGLQKQPGYKKQSRVWLPGELQP